MLSVLAKVIFPSPCFTIPPSKCSEGASKSACIANGIVKFCLLSNITLPLRKRKISGAYPSPFPPLDDDASPPITLLSDILVLSFI